MVIPKETCLWMSDAHAELRNVLDFTRQSHLVLLILKYSLNSPVVVLLVKVLILILQRHINSSEH